MVDRWPAAPKTARQARREGGAEGVTLGGPGFRIVKFRMQNSSAQTTACGRDEVFLISGRNLKHLRALLWRFVTMLRNRTVKMNDVRCEYTRGAPEPSLLQIPIDI